MITNNNLSNYNTNPGEPFPSDNWAVIHRTVHALQCSDKSCQTILYEMSITQGGLVTAD